MTTLHILGSGTPTPTADRYGSSYVVNVGGELVMFDCGPAATHKLVKAGLWPTDVKHLFFTHHHYDHDVDYPCFLLCRWDQNIEQEKNLLSVYGPAPTKSFTEGLIGPDGVFAHDIDARIKFPGSQRVFVNRGGALPRRWPMALAEDVQPGWRLETSRWRVSAANAVHVAPYLDSLAWRIETDDQSIVFTGDTEPCDSVRNLADGADVLVAMCWNHQDQMDCEGEAGGQMGTRSAAKMADDAGVRRLVLVHSGPSFDKIGSIERAIADVSAIYKGEVVFGRELLSL